MDTLASDPGGPGIREELLESWEPVRSQAAGSPDGALQLQAFRPPAPVDNTKADLGVLLGLPYSCEMPPGVCPERQRQVEGGEGPKSSPAPHLLAGGLLRGRRLSPPTCQETEDATSRWGSCWPGPAQEEIGDDGDQDRDKGDDYTEEWTRAFSVLPMTHITPSHP